MSQTDGVTAYDHSAAEHYLLPKLQRS